MHLHLDILEEVAEDDEGADEEDEQGAVLVQLREEGEIAGAGDERAGDSGREEGEEGLDEGMWWGRGLSQRGRSRTHFEKDEPGGLEDEFDGDECPERRLGSARTTRGTHQWLDVADQALGKTLS
jgi:hypothetical protein